MCEKSCSEKAQRPPQQVSQENRGQLESVIEMKLILSSGVDSEDATYGESGPGSAAERKAQVFACEKKKDLGILCFQDKKWVLQVELKAGCLLRSVSGRNTSEALSVFYPHVLHEDPNYGSLKRLCP